MANVFFHPVFFWGEGDLLQKYIGTYDPWVTPSSSALKNPRSDPNYSVLFRMTTRYVLVGRLCNCILNNFSNKFRFNCNFKFIEKSDRNVILTRLKDRLYYFVLFGFTKGSIQERFLPRSLRSFRLLNKSKANCNISTIDRTDIPIHRPMIPPRSDKRSLTV